MRPTANVDRIDEITTLMLGAMAKAIAERRSFPRDVPGSRAPFALPTAAIRTSSLRSPRRAADR
jgi:hypothetical protein